mgnify:CR=1 FL=1|tara:strand:- start:6844 stop:7212 length:369 start_codon:yes stop_codon:yes gene_type:complete
MSNLDHRVGVREVSLVVRSLKLDKITDENKHSILTEIDQVFGIDYVSFDDKSQTLNIAYDATNCNLQSLKEIVHKHGSEVSHDLWARFKESYYEFVDENVKENTTHKPWSCHTTPPGSNKNK